jgi:hypothetical protein
MGVYSYGAINRKIMRTPLVSQSSISPFHQGKWRQTSSLIISLRIPGVYLVEFSMERRKMRETKTTEREAITFMKLA